MPKGDLNPPASKAAYHGDEETVGRAWLAPLGIAVFSASLMLIVAIAEGLPIRDPDARYVGSPLALIGVIAGIFLVLDLVPRSWRRSRDTGTPLPASFIGVFEERWWGRRGLTVIASLFAFYVTYISYRNLKSFLPFVTDSNFDGELLSAERWLFFGNDPAELLHDLLGSGFTAEFLSAVYLAFLTFVPISLAVALIWSNRLRVGLIYVTALSICWILGAMSYYVIPALGPIFADPQLFAALPDTGVSQLQETLLAHRREVLADPSATNAVQSIAAFASLHTGVLFAAALVAQRSRSHGAIRAGLWTMLGFTMIATVYFGWHYI
ncbi:MAG: phosphatase PAP2 family protein, partial [Actinomycetota bacterium]|nr:phosphatase PAP2 family protein [Actinomycetota bacterium]